jgi:hypothetical protein
VAKSSHLVLLARLPAGLRDILEHEIREHPDLSLLAEEPFAESELEEPGPGGGRAPDVVIVGSAAASDPRVTTRWFTRFPRARVLVVTPADGSASLYELRRHRSALGQVSPAELVAALRGAMS